MKDCLANIKKKLIETSIIDNCKIEKLIKNMENWRIGDYVYPSDIKSLLNLEFNTVYNILDILKNMGILEYRFKVYCSICDEYLNINELKSLNEFPQELYCNNNHKLNPLDNTVLVYKVSLNY